MSLRPIVSIFTCWLWIIFSSAAWADLAKDLDIKNYGSFIYTERVPNALFFFSEIKQNDSFELRKALRNHNITTLVLSSAGGSVWESLNMAGIVHDKKLTTYVPEHGLDGKGNCASACAFLFFGGDTRIANGKLGVHQFYSGDASNDAKIGDTQENAQFTVSEIIGFLNEFETPPFVYERMFQQTEMYYFSENELEKVKRENAPLPKDNLENIALFIEDINFKLAEIELRKSITDDSKKEETTKIGEEPKPTAPASVQPESNPKYVSGDFEFELGGQYGGILECINGDILRLNLGLIPINHSTYESAMTSEDSDFTFNGKIVRSNNEKFTWRLERNDGEWFEGEGISYFNANTIILRNTGLTFDGCNFVFERKNTRSLDNKVLIKNIQKELNRLGCNAGRVDGIAGKKTLAAFNRLKEEISLLHNYSFTHPNLLNVLKAALKTCKTRKAKGPVRCSTRIWDSAQPHLNLPFTYAKLFESYMEFCTRSGCKMFKPETKTDWSYTHTQKPNNTPKPNKYLYSSIDLENEEYKVKLVRKKYIPDHIQITEKSGFNKKKALITNCH